MPEFVHLHNHSEFSLLKASSSIKGLISTAQAQGSPAIALSDDGNLFGALKFYKACLDTQKSEKPVKPIIGCDFFMAMGSRLERGNNENASRVQRILLIAKNNDGYHRLCELSSLGYTEGFYYRPRIDKELLSQYSKDLIALSGGYGGEIPQLLARNRYQEAREAALWYRETFGRENFFLELTEHGITDQKVINEGLIKLAGDLEIPLVATNDTYYIKQSDWKAHDVLLCIGSKRKVNEANRFRFSSKEFYLKSPEEMEQLFGHVPNALSNTLLISEMVNLKIDLPGPLLPDYVIPDEFIAQSEALVGQDMRRLEERFKEIDNPEILKRLEDPSTKYFVWQSNKGLIKRYGNPPKAELIERLDYELFVIIRMGFVGYFLIVWDFIRWAKDHDIPVGPGRGSGAGSIVAFSMEITDIDPIRYNLLFERFLNPERISMPDFDIDFCFENRQRVIDYVTQKYGADRTGQIITFGTLKPKAVIKDVSRALDISFEEANRIVKFIPDGPTAAKLHLEDLLKEELPAKWKEAGFQENSDGVRNLYSSGDIYKELFDVSTNLEGLSRHTSLHAAGVVIGQDKLSKFVPLYRDPKTGGIATQYTMDQLEDCGLVKMDFLGLKTLTLIKNTEKLIRSSGFTDFDIETVSDSDPATFRLLGEGKSSAVFQFDGEGMQNTLKKAKPTCIEDLTALTSLYRPGPMDYLPQFIDCKWGRKPISYPHPSLENLLKETYGIMVYQEQVMQAAQIVAGYSLGGADMLRRAMGKKKVEEMAKHRKIFQEGAAKQHNLSAEEADKIFDILEKFAGYGFNKSHAAAYSVLSYRTAYLKANFPAQFMAANLTNEINSPDKFRLYLSETRGMGIQVDPPDINVSNQTFAVDQGRIVFGLVGIKGIGEAVVEEIIQARNAGGAFKSFSDFLDRVDLRTVNRKALETLILAGCFDHLKASRKGLMDTLEQTLALAQSKKESRAFGQTGLFDDAPQEEFRHIDIPDEEFESAEKLAREKELLGNYFSGHPLDSHLSDWERSCTLDLSQMELADPEKKYQVLALLISSRVVITKRGKRMALIQFEDYNGQAEAVLFSENYERFQEQLQLDHILGLICKVDLSREKPQLLIEDIKEPSELEDRQGGEIHLQLKNQPHFSKEELYDLRGSLFEQGGQCPVILHVPILQTDGSLKNIRIKAAASMLSSSKPERLGIVRENPCVEGLWKEYPAMLKKRLVKPVASETEKTFGQNDKKIDFWPVSEEDQAPETEVEFTEEELYDEELEV